ncbi:MAG: cell division protein ZapD [Proteobacteria bacterium]|nr:cell division protein ZapD [Pseudomonadota bacterium]
MVLYEYPLNESVRTLLRLEQLVGRLDTLVARDDAIDHHFALATLFDILDVAARADLKSDLLKELERHKAQFQAYRGHPGVSEDALDDVVARIDAAFDALNQTTGKAGQGLTSNEWLMGIRSRIHIPAGTCEFDLPGYYAWQQHPADQRRADLQRWLTELTPLAHALRLMLHLLRDTGMPQRIVATAGQYQQSLAPGKTYQLLRLRLDGDTGLVPEITGHRLMVGVRLMRPDPADGRLRPATDADITMDLALCA